MYLENFPENDDKGKINGDIIFWYLYMGHKQKYGQKRVTNKNVG